MAILLLSSPIEFPIGAVRAALRTHAPHYRWQCGELDEGRPSDRASFDRPHLITGRSATDLVMISIAQEPFTVPGEELPDHASHITLSHPTIDDVHMANRLSVIIVNALADFASTAVVAAQMGAAGQVFDRDGIRNAMNLVVSGVSVDVLELSTLEPDAPLDAAPVSAEQVVSDSSLCLSPIILLLNGSLSFDWSAMGTAITELDPTGDWAIKCDANGRGFLTGRGCMIALMNPAAPLDEAVLHHAVSNAADFGGDLRAVAQHSSQLIISSTIEESAEFVDKQAVARVISFITAVAAHDACVAAVLNARCATLHNPTAVADLQASIAHGEIPVMLWTRCDWHSVRDDAVSLSTSGFAPLLGYEIEVWNAPCAAALVREKVAFLMRYLLDNGPVIGDGDICGVTAGDKAIRCFHRESRAQADSTDPVMCVEFGLPLFDTRAQLRPQSTPKAPEPVVSPPPRPIRGFGRKGL